jgi:uridylate kinase
MRPKIRTEGFLNQNKGVCSAGAFKVMRVVFRIGGSVVASPVNTELMNKYIELLKALKGQGYELAVVVGGGTLAREFIGIAKNLGLEMEAQDEIAISVSRLFAQLFVKKFGDLACGKVAVTLDEAAKCLEAGKIAVMGGLKPRITTDAVAALVAERVGADLLVKGTDQDGIYDKDPRKHADAVKLERISFDDLQSVLSEAVHKAGIHQIIDPEAAKVLKRKRVKLIVVNGFKPENILLAVKGEKVGTAVN